MTIITRRRLLQGAAATIAAGPSLADAAAPQASDETSLRVVGKRAGIPYGLCEPASRFPGNRAYLDRLAAECSYLVPGNDFHWRNVQPARNTFRFTQLDLMARYAAEKELGFVGHTLLWYHAVPDWLKAIDDDKDIYAAMERYVSTTVGRFAGKMVRWDVINEQIEPKDGRGDGLRATFYLERLGTDYIKFAYAKAREADPAVVLCYNEYGFEHRKPEEISKRAALLDLLRKMRDDKVEVDCVGFQSHLDGEAAIDLDGLSAFTREVVGLGYKIAITELDVKDTALPGDIEERDRLVAAKVKDYLDCVTAETKPLTITNWGYTDDKSWYQFYDWSRRRDKRPLRPLAFDAAFRRKAQWDVIADTIRKTTA